MPIPGRWTPTVAAMIIAGCLTSGAFAASGGGDNSGSSKEYRAAEKAIKGERYQQAIDLLLLVIRDEPKSADAYNSLGYSYRKLGRYDEALTHYNRALELEPKHRGANEYLGELYLETDKLEAAEERLRVLDKACFFPCGEYRDLKQMIEEYKQRSQG